MLTRFAAPIIAMAPFFEAWALVLLIPFLLGYPLACASGFAAGPKRLVWAGALGLASLIVALRSAQYLVALRHAGVWFSVLVLIAAAWGWSRRGVRDDIARDFAALGWGGAVALASGILFLLTILNLPIFFDHAIAFEGTQNHDSIIYVAHARWMQQHRFFDPIRYSPAAPFDRIATGYFGWSAGYGRPGAEGLLGWISSLLHRDPVYAYNGVLGGGVIWAALAGLLALPENRSGSRVNYGWPWLLPLFLTPAFSFIAFNSNFANAYGVVFFIAYAAISVDRLRSGLKQSAAAILMLAGLMATYPELIPFAWLTLAFSTMFSAFEPGGSWRSAARLGMRCTLEAEATALIFFWLTISAFFVVAYVTGLTSAGPVGLPDLFAGLPPLRKAFAIATTENIMAARLPMWCIVSGLLSTGWLILRALTNDSPLRNLMRGIACAFFFGMIYIGFQSFAYGQIKLVEYFSPFIAPVMMIGTCSAWKNKSGPVPKWCGAAALATVLAIEAGACFFLARSGLQWGERKHVGDDMIALATAVRSLPSGSSVAMGATPPWSFYYSMWFPYLFPGTPVLFDSKNGGGGYLSDYVSGHPYADYDSADYRIESTAIPATIIPQQVVASAGRFRLVKSGLSIASGAYAREKDFQWLGPFVVFRAHPGSGRFLNVVLAGRFHPGHPIELLAVAQAGNACVGGINTRGQTFSIPLRSDRVQLRFALPVFSPSQFGGRDARKLSYRLIAASLSDSPAYPLLECKAAPVASAPPRR